MFSREQWASKEPIEANDRGWWTYALSTASDGIKGSTARTSYPNACVVHFFMIELKHSEGLTLMEGSVKRDVINVVTSYMFV